MRGKKNNPKLQILFAALSLALIFVIELYAMINMPEDFLVIGLLAFIFLSCVYMLIRAILLLQAEKDARREDQYDNIFKSEKATFLMMKKHFVDIEDKLAAIEENSKLPAEEIVGKQKAIGKIIINRNRENAEAIINSNEELLGTVDGVREAISANNDKLISSYKDINEENMQQIMLKQQDIFMGLKDMEIRLNDAIVQSQKMIAQVSAASVSVPQAQGQPEAEAAGHADVSQEPAVEAMPEIMAEPEQVLEAMPEMTAEPEQAVEAMPEVTAEAEQAVEAIPEVSAEPEQAVEAMPEMTAEPERAVPDNAAQEAVPGTAEELTSPAADAVPEMTVDVASEKPAAAAPAKKTSAKRSSTKKAKAEKAEKPPVTEDSNPNKKLGADEIDALFASMALEATESAAEPEEEVQAPPQIDLSDPNKRMSADEIAALFASMG